MCQQCITQKSCGKTICVYCGGNLIGANIPADTEKVTSEVVSIQQEDFSVSENNQSYGSDYLQSYNQNTSVGTCPGFVFGILSIALFIVMPILTLVFGILAVVFGNQGKTKGQEKSGAAVIMGTIALVLFALLVAAIVLLYLWAFGIIDLPFLPKIVDALTA